MLSKDYNRVVEKNIDYSGIVEKNNGDYLTETAGYLPLKEQIAEMKRAGRDLLAMRMAKADIINATDKNGNFLGFDDIENYDDETADVHNDDLDIQKLRVRYRNLMANQAFASVLEGGLQGGNDKSSPLEEKPLEKPLEASKEG